MIASESAALNALGYEILNDVSPGEAVIVDEKGHLFRKQCTEMNRHSPCLFEFVYFSRPDSTIDSISVHKSRLRMGDLLGEKILNQYSHLKIDVVIPIPCKLLTKLAQNIEKALSRIDILEELL